ncbi:hypothetical protein ACHAXM_009540 [Skeletonema potamos]|jgi:prolyl 4-hydroxylase
MMMEHRYRFSLRPLLLFIILSVAQVNAFCSLSDNEFNNDPALQTMTFDIGYGPQEFRAYVEPDVSTFYNAPIGSYTRKKPIHSGWAAKFINMSDKKVRLFWDPRNGGPGSPITVLRPFEAGGTASFPRHEFYVTPYEDENVILHRWSISPPQAVYYYDPITVPGDEEATQTNLDNLSPQDFESYKRHVDNRDFGKQYFNFTGREYLSMYPRNAPSHKIWRADYFGQEHWVTTRETHFVEHPREDELSQIVAKGRERVLREDEPRILQQYRTQEPYLNMTLKVLSCAPRAFEINNFLSQTEVDHIMYLTTGLKLHRSTTAGEASGTERDQTRNTRTSLNTWVYREKDQIIDTIYRRAADLLRIDEALLRPRSTDEYPNMGTQGSIAEALQLVHYDVGQEYTAHHDFGYDGMFSNKKQPQRFATVLLYLNEPESGGETEFPRWVNAETREGLAVEPKIGKAVLFYSQLGDGNMDDWSHHAALPVKKGEKWLMNLWVWDPVYHD